MSFEALLAGKTPKSALHEYFQLQGGKPVFELIAGALPPAPPSFTCKLTIPNTASRRTDGVQPQTVFTGVARTKKGAEHLASDAAMRYISAIPPARNAGAVSGMSPINFTPAATTTTNSARPEEQHQHQQPQHQAHSPVPGPGAASPNPYGGEYSGSNSIQDYPEEASDDISDEELTATINAMQLEDIRPLVLQAHKEMRHLKQQEKRMLHQLGAYAMWHKQAREILMKDPLESKR